MERLVQLRLLAAHLHGHLLHLAQTVHQPGNRLRHDLRIAGGVGVRRIQLRRAREITQRATPLEQRLAVRLHRAPDGLGGRAKFLAGAAPIHVRLDHLLNVIARQRELGLLNRTGGGADRRAAATGVRFWGGRLLQLLEALVEANMREVVQRGGLRVLVLFGNRRLKHRLGVI